MSSSKTINEKEKQSPFKIISTLLALAAIASTAAFFIYKVFAERTYNEKWKDYDDCGWV